MAVPELRTERLLMRGWLPRDSEPFAAINATGTARGGELLGFTGLAVPSFEANSRRRSRSPG